MAGSSKKTKFFRVAVSGATTDGREISRTDIQQMAANYNPATYGARVNLEHFRGILPDGPFAMYGDVLALKAEEVDIDGKKQLGLFAQLDPTDSLVQLVNVKRQKVYTSIEINPDFAGKGEAYLMGIAVTDSPASLGTEMLRFCAGAASNPLADRKQHPQNLFTAALDTSIELEDDSAGLLQQLGEQFTSRIRQLLSVHKQGSDSDTTQLAKAIELVAESQKDLLQRFSQLQSGQPGGQFASKTDFDKLQAAHDSLVQQLSQQEAGQRRQHATGGNQQDDALDC